MKQRYFQQQQQPKTTNENDARKPNIPSNILFGKDMLLNIHANHGNKINIKKVNISAYFSKTSGVLL